MTQMTHNQAVRRIAAHLGGTRQCTVVLTEYVSRIDEQPDAIGWKGGESTLVEVKVSRADFLADKTKRFRRFEEMGVGDIRFFAAPKGVLTPEDMPDGWGLLEIQTERIYERKAPERKPANKMNEVMMLTSVIRRLEISTAVFVRHEPIPVED